MLNRTTALTSSELKSAIVPDPLIVKPETTVMDAIAQMSGIRTICHATKTINEQLDELHLEVRSSCVLVVEDGQLLGILTERDIVRLTAQQHSLEHLAIREVMTSSVVTLYEADFTDLFFAINLLQQYRIRHLPILDKHDRLVGLVTHESLRQTARPVDLLRLRVVSEVMTSEVICAAPDSSMLAIAQQMSTHQVSSVMIVQPGGSPVNPHSIPVGILTERDIVQFQALGLNLTTYLAQALMSTPIFAVQPDDSLCAVQQIMEQRWIRRLAVTGKQGELLGIITQTSLLQALNPLELYKLAEVLEEKVVRLEAEKVQILENRTLELEQQVEARTIALQAKAERERLVLALATQIRSSLSLKTILDTTVEQVRQVLGCDRVNIWQFDADERVTVIAESTDSSLSLVGERINDPYFNQNNCAESYRQGWIRIVPDIYKAKMTDCHYNLLVRLQTRAKILVPLLCGDELWGLLNVTESQHARDWQPEEVELLQALSVQLAIALQQATTYQKLQEQLIERQQTEARLRESEQRYVTLTAAVSVGIFRTDVKGNCTYVNDSWCQIAGLTPEEAAGEGWVRGLHPDDRGIIAAKWHQFTHENQPFRLEYRFRRPDGIVTWVYGQSVAEYDTEGQLIGYVGTITDISEAKRDEAVRKHSEESLQKSESHQRALISAIPDLLMRLNREGIYLEFVATPNFAVVGNLTQIVGTHVSETLPPDHAQKRMESIQLALQTNSIQIYEQDLSIDGRIQIEEVRVVPYSQDEVLALVRDISEAKRDEVVRKQAEAALIQSEAQSRAILAAIPDFMFRMSADGVYQGFVTANREIDLLPKAFDPIGLRSADYLPAEIVTRQLHYIDQALRTGELQVYEQQVQIGERLQDEEVRVVKSGEDEVLFMIRDISEQQAALRERKQAEQQLFQLNQALEAKVKARTVELQEREVELQKLSERLALALKSGAIGCWEWDIQQNTVLWDERMYELYDVPKQSDPCVSYNIWANRLHPDDLISTETLNQQVLAGQTEYDTEFRVVHSDGSIHFIKAYGMVVQDAQGNPHSMIGVNFDISKAKRDEVIRKQAEQKLQQQAEQKRLLGSITQRMRSSLNLNEILNATIEELHQVLQADRVLIYRVFPGGTGAAIAESASPIWPKILNIVFPEEVFPEENYDRYVQGRVYVLNDREDKHQFVLPCLAEFLAEIQVRAKLVVPIVQNQTLWGLLIAHQCDRPRQWQDWEINLLKQTVNQLAIAIQQSSLFEQLQTELAERQWAEARLTETNAQLAISNEGLARATRLKDEFLANMSHELRTPLNAILGMTEGLQEEVFGSINPRQLKALQTVERSGSHLLELINDILDVSKIEAGQIELDCTPVSAARLCKSSLAFIKQQALQKRIQLDIKLQLNLPDLLVDERRIRQVLINLLNNAVKFTPEGGRIVLEVSQSSSVESQFPNLSTLDSPQEFLQIAVTDTGIGIAPENIKKLFQPFIQIDSALNRQYAGTGLGLALVKRIVELHGGKVGLTSELGVGSCFTIALPCTFDAPHVPKMMAAHQSTAIELDSLGNEPVSPTPLILLVEDNEANISTVSSYLGAKGYQILLATNGQVAIDLAKAHQPDLVLMDIQMPGVDGLEAIRQIRLDANLIDTPIVALTALAMPGDREDCLEAGANDYLTKPVKLKQLAATIQHFLDARNSNESTVHSRC
jgi:PAS domain S-box-containing protein